MVHSAQPRDYHGAEYYSQHGQPQNMQAEARQQPAPAGAELQKKRKVTAQADGAHHTAKDYGQNHTHAGQQHQRFWVIFGGSQQRGHFAPHHGEQRGGQYNPKIRRFKTQAGGNHSFHRKHLLSAHRRMAQGPQGGDHQ